jgi:hypothetical protein
MSDEAKFIINPDGSVWAWAHPGGMILLSKPKPAPPKLPRVGDPDYLRPVDYVIDCDWDGD